MLRWARTASRSRLPGKTSRASGTKSARTARWRSVAACGPTCWSGSTGRTVDSDDLFLQHTYLTIVTKAMAARVLRVGSPDARELLTGRPFREVGIAGVAVRSAKLARCPHCRAALGRGHMAGPGSSDDFTRQWATSPAAAFGLRSYTETTHRARQSRRAYFGPS